MGETKDFLQDFKMDQTSYLATGLTVFSNTQPAPLSRARVCSSLEHSKHKLL